jgi:hypothetical protein
MDEGFVADYGHGTSARQEQWVQGQPEGSFWTGTKVYGKERYHIVSFRCVDCGYLESYAWDPA